MANKFIAALALCSAFLLSGCIKENYELMYANQETRIDSFVQSTLKSNPEYTVSYNDGSVRITVVAGNGPEIEKKNSVSILYAGYTFNGGISANNLFATNIMEIAQKSGWDTSDEEAFKPLEVKLSDRNLVEGLVNGLVGTKPGEECIILFSGKHGFGKKQNGTISANSPIAYHVLVTGISD